MTPEAHEGSRGIRDQIGRYRTAFLSIISMIVLALAVGGYILSHERLHLPGWVPVLGREYFTLKGEFQTAQAVTPGQGQAVTIAGAKIGEIASVELTGGRALVTMHITPKYARIYHDATMLLRPKTQLKDMAVEVNPGKAASGRLHSGAVIPVSQTAPDVNFDEFLSSLDSDTRAYLQELLAGAGEGLKGNSRDLSAALKQFDPLARNLQQISKEVAVRHTNVEHAIHNFRELVEALGDKDKSLAELVDSSNAVFRTFAQQDHAVQETIKALPGALKETNQGLGKLSRAAHVLGPTLKELEPTAKALGPALKQSRPFFKQTTPIIKNQIRPFAREVLPVVNQLQPAFQQLAQASPELSSSFSVINEFFNELAYNPGPNQGGFLFFLDWANHNLNSALAQGDAHGAVGHTLLYFNCNIVKILSGAEVVNPEVALILGLLGVPSEEKCKAATGTATGTTASARGSSAQGISQLAGHVFGQGPDSFVAPSTAIGGGN